MGWLNNLRKLKKESGLSMKEISAQSGMSEPTLEKLFAGKSKDPKLTTLLMLCEFFDCSLDYLVYGEETEKSPDTDESAPRDDKEKKIMELVSRLDDSQKDLLLVMLEATVSQTQ